MSIFILNSVFVFFNLFLVLFFTSMTEDLDLAEYMQELPSLHLVIQGKQLYISRQLMCFIFLKETLKHLNKGNER